LRKGLKLVENKEIEKPKMKLKRREELRDLFYKKKHFHLSKTTPFYLSETMLFK
jgi:hypothetical protein